MPILTKARVFGAAILAAATPLALTPVAATATPVVLAQAQSVGDYDSEQLDSFVMAMIEVRRIGEEVRPELEAATDPAEQQEIQQQASERMVEAVEAEGIEVETYNAIIEDANADPELATRIGERLEQLESE
ncbi:MAG: DUF4168 domain-containing protein [Paracoccaceae bacterium]